MVKIETIGQALELFDEMKIDKINLCEKNEVLAVTFGGNIPPEIAEMKISYIIIGEVNGEKYLTFEIGKKDYLKARELK